MSEKLIRVAKDGAVLLVHPTTLEGHKKVGWAVSDDQDNTEDPGAEPKARGKGKATVEPVAEREAQAETQPEAPAE